MRSMPVDLGNHERSVSASRRILLVVGLGRGSPLTFCPCQRVTSRTPFSGQVNALASTVIKRA